MSTIPLATVFLQAMEKSLAQQFALAEKQGRRNAKGIDDAEKRIDALEKTIAYTGKIFLFRWDIPDKIKAKVPNPRRMIRLIGGAPTQWSFAILTEETLASPTLKEWTENAILQGADIEIDEMDGPKCRAVNMERAKKALYRELTDLHRSLLDNIEAASKRCEDARLVLDEAEKAGESISPRDRSTVEDARITAIRTLLNRAADDFRGVLLMAERFDDYGSSRDLLNALRGAINVQSAAFNAEVAALAMVPGSRAKKQAPLV